MVGEEKWITDMDKAMEDSKELVKKLKGKIFFVRGSWTHIDRSVKIEP
jgi:hypothetical protein